MEETSGDEDKINAKSDDGDDKANSDDGDDKANSGGQEDESQVIDLTEAASDDESTDGGSAAPSAEVIHIEDNEYDSASEASREAGYLN